MSTEENWQSFSICRFCKNFIIKQSLKANVKYHRHTPSKQMNENPMNGSFLDNCSSHRTMAVVFFSFFSNSRIQSLPLTPSGHHHYTFISSGDSSQGTNINTRTPFSGILITSSEATPTPLCGRAPTYGDERVHLQTAFRTLA